MMNMVDIDPVATNLKRAYREGAPQNLPPQMQHLLRKLQQQEEEEKAEQ